jgi:serine phosphatase RsbU (regulator of sigma subunit)
LRNATWDAPAVSIGAGDHLLMYTDGISEALADEDGRAEERFARLIDRAREGDGPMLDSILEEIQRDLAGAPQPDDLTLLAATILD